MRRRKLNGSSSARAIGNRHFLRRLGRWMWRQVNTAGAVAFLWRWMRSLSGRRWRSDLLRQRSGEIVRNDENALRRPPLVTVSSVRHFCLVKGQNAKKGTKVLVLRKFWKCGGKMCWDGLIYRGVISQRLSTHIGIMLH